MFKRTVSGYICERQQTKVLHLGHVLAGVVRLSLWLAPLFISILAVVGLELYTITGNQKAALWICGVAVGASIVLMPIALWLLAPSKCETEQHSRRNYSHE